MLWIFIDVDPVAIFDKTLFIFVISDQFWPTTDTKGAPCNICRREGAFCATLEDILMCTLDTKGILFNSVH